MNIALRDVATASPPSGVEPAIRVTSVAKRFDAREVLRGVDLEIAPGAAVALIGANGAGKSTLLRTLIRLVEPDQGRIDMLGQNVTALTAAELRAFRKQVGIVFQRHNLVGRLSALSNVVHGVQARESGPQTWMQSFARDAVRSEAHDCLAAVGLAGHAMHRSDRLSGGQSQRVAIARMLMQRPRIILADEPDASLDPHSGDEVMSLLYRLAKDKGLTLVVISHRLEHTVRYSDRIVGLAGGAMTLDTPSDNANAAELRRFFEPDRLAA